MCLISLANTRKLQIRGKMGDIFILLLSSFGRHSKEKSPCDAHTGPPTPPETAVSGPAPHPGRLQRPPLPPRQAEVPRTTPVLIREGPGGVIRELLSSTTEK